MCGISRESVYKRIKKGNAILLEDSEVAVIDTYLSKGKMQRNDFTKIKTDNSPDWL